MTSYYLKGFATFMARVIEAPSVSFVNGGGAAGREILSGETVYQTSNNLAGGTVNAVYKAMRSPFYRAAKSGGQRPWSSGTEQGVLLLERIAGRAPLGPVHGALYGGLEDLRRRASRGNRCGHRRRARRRQRCGLPQAGQLAHVLRGDPSGNAPADTNPFNNYRGSVLRNSVLWPPDNPEDTAINSDNFTLLRFSDYVKADR